MVPTRGPQGLNILKVLPFFEYHNQFASNHKFNDADLNTQKWVATELDKQNAIDSGPPVPNFQILITF